MSSFSDNTIKEIHGDLEGNNQKNVCVFSHFDVNNIVLDYVINYLKSLSFNNCDIIFVSTADKLNNSVVKKLLQYVKVVILRKNVGYDFGSYKCGIEYVSEINKYEKLIIANDSVYGPLYDLKNLIEFGDKRGLDMWGVTDSYQLSYHLQSYFIV